MRVISQWTDVDIDYESSTFTIKETEMHNDGSTNYVVIAYTANNKKFIMGTYKREETAEQALMGLSKAYCRYIITDNTQNMVMTDALVCEMDKPFNKIDIQYMPALMYVFPEDLDFVGLEEEEDE